MEEVQYKVFSRRTHNKIGSLNNPSLCQFELTFRCGLRCKHCYTDCYNRPNRLKKELSTKQVKFILDKVYEAGTIWLCFTGGDPLTRPDFLDIYSYARNKGFIIILFTNGCSMTEEIAASLAKSPPFVVEITLNAVTRDIYEKISQAKGSFDRVMKGIDLILSHKLPLKIKTQMNRDNLKHAGKIKEFIQAKGLKFQPSVDLYARLDCDTKPCSLRVKPQEALNLNSGIIRDCLNTKDKTGGGFLFRCAIAGGSGLRVDPYGNTFLCNLIRNPAFSLLKVDVKAARQELLSWARGKKFSSASKCKSCKLRRICLWCPGRAYVEKKNMEAPIDYYCELAKLSAAIN